MSFDELYSLPVSHPFRLLLSAIPDGRQEDETRLTGRFKYAQQCSHNYQASKILAGSMAGQDCPPSYDTKAEILGDGYSCDDEVLRVFHE